LDSFLLRIGYKKDKLKYIPFSAFKGDNLN
jgi:translation elongation factor EF-1alpha